MVIFTWMSTVLIYGQQPFWWVKQGEVTGCVLPALRTGNTLISKCDITLHKTAPAASPTRSTTTSGGWLVVVVVQDELWYVLYICIFCSPFTGHQKQSVPSHSIHSAMFESSTDITSCRVFSSVLCQWEQRQIRRMWWMIFWPTILIWMSLKQGS